MLASATRLKAGTAHACRLRLFPGSGGRVTQTQLRRRVRRPRACVGPISPAGSRAKCDCHRVSLISRNDVAISPMSSSFMRTLAHASLARLMTPATPTQLASSYSLTRRVRTCTRSRPSGPSRLAGTEHNTNARMRAEAVADQLLIPFWSAGSSAIAALAACLDGFLSNAARCAQSEQSTSRPSTACRPSVRARPGTPTRTLASRGRWRGGSRAPRRRRQRLR